MLRHDDDVMHVLLSADPINPKNLCRVKSCPYNAIRVQ